MTGVYHRDLQTELKFDEDGQRILDANQVRSGIIPAWPTERATVAVERDFGKFGITAGAIWAGSPLNGSSFQDVTGGPGNYTVYEDKVTSKDNWGGKAKVTFQSGKINAYAQAAVMGLVANAGADQTQTFTGWKLKDNGAEINLTFLPDLPILLAIFKLHQTFYGKNP
eukprot:TRINITY_DN6426_c0_g1_i1.p1 TRINITY_DN6426_c0_g1~~TRINITY_DN6426_c0_g1_i1.p1  ORF type:complete len:168 (+),score=42.22 TRINITY_DN6426_c0_g1_i1:650-1153(+)